MANLSVPPDCEKLTGFARTQHEMSMRLAERPNGWPVGCGYLGRALACATPTVQIIRQPHLSGTARYVAVTLFPFLRTDRRYPPSEPLTLHRARRMAMRRLWLLVGKEQVILGRGKGIDLARGGAHIGLEVL